MLTVYVLLNRIEYEPSTVLGVFSSFDAALREANRHNEDNGQTQLLERSQYGEGVCYEPFKNNCYFYEIEEHEVKGE
jgi:hypothetical protein